jgi:hypothetical protein
MTFTVIGPSPRARKIAECEAVLHDLREFPVDAEPYVEEVRSVEAELRELLEPDHS